MIRNEDICAEVQSGLPLYVGGDLELAQAQDIALHLEQCQACHEKARAAHESRALLVSALELSERRGPDLWPNVRAVLSENGLIRTQPSIQAGPQIHTQLQPEIASNAAWSDTRFGAPVVAKTARGKARTAPRLLSYAAAAAAALMAGVWLGRAALQAPSDASPEGGSVVKNLVTVPVNEGPAVPLTRPGTVPIVPIADTGALRPLRQGEVPMSLGARSYFDSPWIDGWASNDPRQAVPASRLMPRSQ